MSRGAAKIKDSSRQGAAKIKDSISRMSTAAVVEPPRVSHIEVEASDEKRDKLGDLVDQMDNVKLGDSTTPTDLVVGLGGPEKVVKHPLQNSWTLWFFKNDKTRSWEENQKPIITVNTVEDFWSLYNHIGTFKTTIKSFLHYLLYNICLKLINEINFLVKDLMTPPRCQKCENSGKF